MKSFVFLKNHNVPLARLENSEVLYVTFIKKSQNEMMYLFVKWVVGRAVNTWSL